MKIKIEETSKIKITIGDAIHEISIQELRQLRDAANEILGDPPIIPVIKEIPWSRPSTTPYIPDPLIPSPYKIWCSTERPNSQTL